MINILCDRALVGAYAKSLAVVDGSTVKLAAKEIGDSIPGRRHWLWWWPAAAATSALVLSVLLWLLSSPWGSSDAVATAPASKNTQTAALAPPASSTVSLGSVLLSATAASDTARAFRGLCQLWSVADVELAGRAACEVAREQGLRCLFGTGGWGELRKHNRPSVIELLDERGQRHHVLVERLASNQAALNFGGQRYLFAQAEIDRYWFGKYLLLWRPPSTVPETLRRGARGAAVIWLRRALARAQGVRTELPLPSPGAELFDWELETQLKAFQRRHQLVADGVVGQFTLMQLNLYTDDAGTPRLWQDAAIPSA